MANLLTYPQSAFKAVSKVEAHHPRLLFMQVLKHRID